MKYSKFLFYATSLVTLLCIYYLVWFRFHFLAWLLAAILIMAVAMPSKRNRNTPLWRQQLQLAIFCSFAGVALWPIDPSRGFSDDCRRCVLDELTATVSDHSVSVVSRAKGVKGVFSELEPERTFVALEVERQNSSGQTKRVFLSMYERKWTRCQTTEEAYEYIFEEPANCDKSYRFKQLIAVRIEPYLVTSFQTGPFWETVRLCLEPLSDLRYRLMVRSDDSNHIRKARKFEWWPTYPRESWVFVQDKEYVNHSKGWYMAL